MRPRTERRRRALSAMASIMARVKAAKRALRAPGFNRLFADVAATYPTPKSLDDVRTIALAALRSLGLNVDGVSLTMACDPVVSKLDVWCRPAVDAVERAMTGAAVHEQAVSKEASP